MFLYEISMQKTKGKNMKEPIISNLEHITKKMIKALERWLADEKYDRCPFRLNCERRCHLLFENLSEEHCPCFFFGQDATVLAFTIICDVWKAYHAKP